MRELPPVFGAPGIEHQNPGTEENDLEMIIDTLEVLNELSYSEKDTELAIITLDLTFIG